MIPKRTLTATLEISTGSMIITNRPPAFTGEADALTVSVSVLDGGAAYTPVGNVLAKLYLYWPGTINMSEAVDLTISGSTLTGSLPDTLTAVPGCPLMVIQLTDADTQDLIVAAASPIQITNVLGERVISSRPATPSEIIYIGRAPYIDPTTGHWMQWSVDTSGYIDTGVSAAGRPATFTARATTLPAGSDATASMSGTAENPVLNLGIPRGDTGTMANRYATCSTAAGTAAKTATITTGTFTLETGATVYVKFTNSNTVASPTLNVNSTGAKPIMRYGTTAAGTSAASSWTAGAVVPFTYDGTNWIMQSAWDNNTTYSNAGLGQGYGTCTTAAATAAKVVALSSYALTTGGVVSVKFTNSVPASATMNINSKGAKAIFYKGAAITAGVIEAGDLATFIYDGTHYHLLSIDRWHDDLSDLSQQIDNLFSAIAYIESGTTASRTYKKGDYVIVQNTLYIVTTAIAESATFTINTNIISVGDKGGLNSLKYTKLGELSVINVELTVPNSATELFTSLTITSDNANAQNIFIIDWDKNVEYYGISLVGADATIIATLCRVNNRIRFIRCIYGSDNPAVFTADIYWR